MNNFNHTYVSGWLQSAARKQSPDGSTHFNPLLPNMEWMTDSCDSQIYGPERQKRPSFLKKGVWCWRALLGPWCSGLSQSCASNCPEAREREINLMVWGLSPSVVVVVFLHLDGSTHPWLLTLNPISPERPFSQTLGEVSLCPWRFPPPPEYMNGVLSKPLWPGRIFFGEGHIITSFSGSFPLWHFNWLHWLSHHCQYWGWARRGESKFFIPLFV